MSSFSSENLTRDQIGPLSKENGPSNEKALGSRRFCSKGFGSRRFWPQNLGLQTLKPRLYIWGLTKGHLVSHSPLFFFRPRSPTCLGHTRTLIFFEGTTNQLTWKQFEIVLSTALPISIFALARQTENRGAGSIGLRQYLPKYLLQITVNTKYSTPLEYSISDILSI